MNSDALHIGGHASRLATYPWRKPAAHCFRVCRPNLGPVAPPSQEAAGAAMSRPQIAPAVVMKGSRGQLLVFQLERIITPSTRDFRHSFRAALPPQAGVVPTAASLSKAGDNSFLRVAPPLRWRSTWCPDTTHNQANRSPSMRTVNSCSLRWERRASVFLWGVPCLSWQWDQTPPLVRLRRTTARERLGDTTLLKVYIDAMRTRPGSGSETA